MAGARVGPAADAASATFQAFPPRSVARVGQRTAPGIQRTSPSESPASTRAPHSRTRGRVWITFLLFPFLFSDFFSPSVFFSFPFRFSFFFPPFRRLFSVSSLDCTSRTDSELALRAPPFSLYMPGAGIRFGFSSAKVIPSAKLLRLLPAPRRRRRSDRNRRRSADSPERAGCRPARRAAAVADARVPRGARRRAGRSVRRREFRCRCGLAASATRLSMLALRLWLARGCVVMPEFRVSSVASLRARARLLC